MDSRSVSPPTKPTRRFVGRSILAALTLLVSIIGTVDGFTPSPVAATGPTQLQAVYVVPADVAPVAGRNSATSDTVIATQDWFADQLGGTYPVFNRTAASIDVPTVVLDETAAELFALTTNAVDTTVTDQVEDQVAGASGRELLVFLEGEVNRSACGYRSSLIMIPIPNCDIAPSSPATFPYGATYLVAHEITHMLGAARSCATNYDGSGHVTDDNRDIIYNGAGGRDWQNLMLDPGNDDYLDQGFSGCFNIRDSALLGIWSEGSTPVDDAPALPSNPTGNCRKGPVDEAYQTSDATRASVYRLYCAYFLRFPESEGYAYWFDEFASGRRDLDNISNFFASGQEFDTTYGSLSNTAFVELIYRNVLQRDAEPEGAGFWLAQLDAGSFSRGEVMLFFSQSDEFRSVTGT